MENTISNANKFAMSQPTDKTMSWQEIMVDYANDYNKELLKDQEALIECLESVVDLQKSYYGNATDTHVELIGKAKEIVELLTNLKTKELWISKQ